MRSVVLLSGGIDSATTLAIALQEGEVHALTIDYGQRHRREMVSAGAIAQHFGVPHTVVKLDLSPFRSALTRKDIPVPEGDVSGIPSTYVPARNIIFLSIAVGMAESQDADAVYIGANAVDYSGYPDCRPGFIDAYQKVVDVGTKRGMEGRGVRIVAPIISLTKGEIIRKGHELGVPFDKTWSCYRGGEKACGRCPSCLIRLKGFREAGLEDPLPYEEVP